MTINETPSRGLALLVAAIPIVVALMLDPGSADPFASPKLLMLRLLTALAAAAAAVVASLGSGLRLPRTATLAPLIAIASWFTVSALLSDSPWRSLFGEPGSRMGLITWLHLLFLCGLSASLGHDRKAKDLLTHGLVIAAAVVAAIAVLQRLGIDLFTLPAAQRFTERAQATTATPLALASLLALAVPLTLSGIRDASRWRRVGAYTVNLLLLLGLATTASRAAIISAITAFALGLWLYRRDPAQSRLSTILTVLVTIVAMVFAVGAFGPRVTYRFERALLPARLDYSRGQVWEGARGAIERRPLLGTGLDGFTSGFARDAPPRWFEARGDDRLPSGAHSLPLDLASKTGLVGFGLCLWLGIALLTTRRREGNADPAPIAFALLAFAGQAMFNDLDLAVAPAVAILVGLLGGGGGRAWMASRRGAALALLVVILASGDIYFASRDAIAERLRAAASATRAESIDSVLALAKAESAAPDLAETLGREALHWQHSRDARASAALAGVAATAIASHATTVMPHHIHLHRELAAELIDLAAVTGSPNRRASLYAVAAAELDLAIQMAPADHRGHVQRARLEAAAGASGDHSHLKKAIAGIDHALGLAPGLVKLFGDRFALEAALGRPQAILERAAQVATTPSHQGAVWTLAAATLLEGARDLAQKDHADGAHTYLTLAATAAAKARELRPEDADAAFAHSVILSALGDEEAARAAVTRALELEPKHRGAAALHKRLGR